MDNLGYQDLSDLGTFLLRYMSMETRHKLMGERPVIYKLLCPQVSDDTIIAKVRESLTEAGKLL